VDRQIRATSFGSAADDYARYRPAPPAEAAEWAVGHSPGLVIDLAAGTGNLARHLLRMTDEVVAVDIDRRMLASPGQPAAGRAARRGPGRGVALRVRSRRGARDFFGVALAGPATGLAGDSPRDPTRWNLRGDLGAVPTEACHGSTTCWATEGATGARALPATARRPPMECGAAG
jgi:SAM-dependent methyltransferase